MDITTFVQFISQIGFPIACTIAMFYLLEKEREEHKSESEKWTEAINNNTKMMEKVLDRLENRACTQV